MNGHWEGFIDVPGGRLYSEADGDGPPVVLIHAGVAHLRMWDEQVEAWSDRYRVIRYDTRGFGRSVVEDVPFSNRADVAAVMDHHGAPDAHVLGMSRGSIIALDFTVENAERVRSLTWVAGGVRGLEIEDDPRDVAVYEQTQPLETAKDWQAIVDLETQLWTDGPGQPSDRVDPEVRRKMIQWNLESYRAEQNANQPIQPDVPASELLHRLTMPMLATWGTLDVSSTLRSGEWLVEHVPGIRSRVFEGVAHMVNLERPQEFNELVGDFLDAAEKGGVSGGER